MVLAPGDKCTLTIFHALFFYILVNGYTVVTHLIVAYYEIIVLIPSTCFVNCVAVSQNVKCLSRKNVDPLNVNVFCMH